MTGSKREWVFLYIFISLQHPVGYVTSKSERLPLFAGAGRKGCVRREVANVATSSSTSH